MSGLRPALFTPLLALLIALIAPLPAWAEPGYQWEIGMEMEGMPFPMPKQTVCVPKTEKEPPVTADDGECRILSKKRMGKRYQWKAECREGVMEGEVTSSPTSYSGRMKMSQRNGEVMAMRMNGRRTGECDTRQANASMEQMQAQSQAAVALSCKEGLEAMQGALLTSGACPKEQPVFCRRLATPEGYDKFLSLYPAEAGGAMAGMIDSAFTACKLKRDTLLPKLCNTAVGQENFDFIGHHCPQDQPRLCGRALTLGDVSFVAAHCPAEREKLIAEHCMGRKSSSEIAEKYQSFCMHAGADAGPNREDEVGHHPAERGEPAGGDSGLIPSNIEDGLRLLKGLMGF